jgi:hypothetical protein
VPRVRERDRVRPGEEPVAGERVDTGGRREGIGIDPELRGERSVHAKERGRAHRGRSNARVEALRKAGEAVVEGDQ